MKKKKKKVFDVVSKRTANERRRRTRRTRTRTRRKKKKKKKKKKQQSTIDRNKVKGLDALGNSRTSNKVRPCHVGYS